VGHTIIGQLGQLAPNFLERQSHLLGETMRRRGAAPLADIAGARAGPFGFDQAPLLVKPQGEDATPLRRDTSVIEIKSDMGWMLAAGSLDFKLT